MARTLGLDEQDDFSAGAYPLQAREQIPSNAAEDLVNCLIGDDGLPYRRGGSSYKGTAMAGLGTNPGRWVYDAALVAGERTFGRLNLAGGSQQVIELNPVDDLTQIDPSTLITGTGDWARADLKAAILRRVAITPGLRLWAGANDASSSAVPSGTGSITLTNGSTTVVGVGTAWLAGAAGAGLFIIGADTINIAVVASVSDATHLELTEPWAGATITKAAGSWGSSMYTSGYWPQTAAGYTSVSGFQIFGAVADKLLAASGGQATGGIVPPQNRIWMSQPGQPISFLSTNYWDLPAGAQVLGIEAYRDTGIVFSTAGVWGIYNLSLDLTDDAGNVQQRLEELNRDIILWSWAGVAGAHGELVVPALDGIYMFNPVGGASRIDTGIGPLYQSYIEAGYRAGQAAIFGDTYVLPIKNGDVPVDLLTCRLRPTRRWHRRGLFIYGWSRQAGYAADVAAVAVRSRQGEKPTLLGMHRTSGRILTLKFWTPGVGNENDADGSSHIATVTTREFRIPNGVKNLLARLRVRYGLVGAGTTVSAQYSVDGAAPVALTVPSATAPPAGLGTPKTWTVGKRGLGVRFILSTAGPVSSFVLHALEAFIRPSGRT